MNMKKKLISLMLAGAMSVLGAGALAAACVKSCEVIAFADLGCESVKLLRVERFPLIVAADCTGAEVFSAGRRQWAGKA